MIETLITFIIIFGIIVAIHEYGHLWWAKRSGILVREYAVGMGPKIFAHQAKDGTLYTIRILPLGGYVRLAGWGDDKTEIKKGQAASLVVSKSEVVNPEAENSVSNIVRRINLSEHVELEEAIPMLITEYDFEKELFIEGEVLGKSNVILLIMMQQSLKKMEQKFGLHHSMFNINQPVSFIKC